jgi:hypothetical protein
MIDWKSISAFMRAVVPWLGSDEDPGWGNLHYDFAPKPNQPKRKNETAMPGWAIRSVEGFTQMSSFALSKPEQFPNQFLCVSMQKENTGANKSGNNYKALRRKANALALKSVWVDVNIKPGAPKHYHTDTAAQTAIPAFQKTVGQAR